MFTRHRILAASVAGLSVSLLYLCSPVNLPTNPSSTILDSPARLTNLIGLHQVPMPSSSLYPVPRSVTAEELRASLDSTVRGLGALDVRAGEQPFSGVMQILNISADGVSSGQATSLEQSVSAGLAPISIIEPGGLDLTQPQPDKATIDKYLRMLFTSLAQASIGVKQLGPVVVCPEFNTGFGGDPARYASYLNSFLESVHAAAPNALASNMIDMNEAQALLPTLHDVNQDLLTTIGIQAFANGQTIPFVGGKADVSGYLNVADIARTVEALGNKPVWLNTGIIREDANLGKAGTYTPQQRLAIANSTADVIIELKQRGVKVQMVNLFAQNKLSGNDTEGNTEKRDFSFHPGDEKILTSFATRMQAIDVKLSGFALVNDTVPATN